MSSNPIYYIKDNDNGLHAFGFDSDFNVEIEFDDLKKCMAAATKYAKATGHKVTIHETYTVDAELIEIP